jgi:predicted nucleic acid-binding protein
VPWWECPRKELHLTRGASFWDALILAACVDAGVEIL